MKKFSVAVVVLFSMLMLSVASAACSHKFNEWHIFKDYTDHSAAVFVRRCEKCGEREYDSRYPEGTLYKNMKGSKPEILVLQKKLLDLGYSKIGVRGVYDINVYKCVYHFQTKHGLEATGIAYPQTLKAIDEACSLLAASAENNGGALNLRKFDDRYYTVDGMNRLLSNFEAQLKPDELYKCTDIYNAAFDALKISHPEITTSLYYVESSRTLKLDLTCDEKTDRYMLGKDIDPISPSYSIIRDRLHVDRIEHFEIISTDMLFDYFYATDHHWNYKGAYKGYTEVVRMLLGEDEPLIIPKEEYTFPIIFNGSSSKLTRMPLSDEMFTVYVFDGMPEYTSYVNGKKRAYNSSKQYFAGKYTSDTYTNHYGLFYGADYAKVEFSNPAAPDRSLLIIGSSYSNAVKTLLTAHYRSILFIDPRHYADEYGKPFSLTEAADEYTFSDILLLFDVDMLSNEAYTIVA